MSGLAHTHSSTKYHSDCPACVRDALGRGHQVVSALAALREENQRLSKLLLSRESELLDAVTDKIGLESSLAKAREENAKLREQKLLLKRFRSMWLVQGDCMDSDDYRGIQRQLVELSDDIAALLEKGNR